MSENASAIPPINGVSEKTSVVLGVAGFIAVTEHSVIAVGVFKASRTFLLFFDADLTYAGRSFRYTDSRSAGLLAGAELTVVALAIANTV